MIIIDGKEIEVGMLLRNKRSQIVWEVKEYPYIKHQKYRFYSVSDITARLYQNRLNRIITAEDADKWEIYTEESK